MQSRLHGQMAALRVPCTASGSPTFAKVSSWVILEVKSQLP